MKIELLTTFIEVCRTLHFRLASESLFITQSAVSARIKLLENELGVLLFDRTTKHLKLTAEGHKLIKYAHELILLWQQAKQDIAAIDNQSTLLSIGSMVSIWDIVLQNWLQRLNQNINDLNFSTNINNPIELRKSVTNGSLDIAFVFEPPLVEQIISERVSTVPLYLVSSDADFSINNKQLNDYIMVDYGEAVNTQHRRAFSDAPPAKHYMSQPIVALNFILASGGSAYLPRQMVMEHLQQKQLHLVEDAPVYSREVYAIYLAGSQKIELIKEVLQHFPELTS